MRRFIGVAAAAMTVALSFGASAALGTHALSPARYAALDAVNTALIPLDRSSFRESLLTAAERTCNGLDRADVLLASVRGECRAVLRAIRRDDRLSRCRTRMGCRRAAAGLRRAITSYRARARSANRVIDASVPDPACRQALRTSAQEFDDARRSVLTLRAFERALRTGSRADIRRAEKRYDALGYSGSTFRQQRDRFRSACG